MLGKERIVFDPSALSESDNIGAYLRSSASGALITNRSWLKPSAGTFNFVDGDVTVGTDSIAETAHGFYTGDKVQLTTSGTLPAGLALLTNYYVIRVDANNIKLASSPMNAELGIPVDITAAAGGGTHTLTGQESDVRALDVWINNPSVVVSDGGGSISIDDNGGSITVDGTVAITGDVNVTQGTSPWVVGDGGGSLTVDAVDLDIRDLTHVSDSIKIGDGTDFLAINADGSINVNADISVVNGHEKAEDAAHASGDIGSFMLAIRNDAAATSLTSANGDYSGIAVDEFGRMFTSTSLTAEKLEDAAHASGDSGIFTLAVAQATLAASVSADGDYGAFKLNDRGALWTAPVGTVADDAADTENPVKVGSRARIGVLQAISADADRADLLSDRYRRIWVNNSANVGVTATTVSVGTSEVELVPASMSGRKKLYIQNVTSNKTIYIGPTGVTASNGIRISPGGFWVDEVGENVSIFAISSGVSTDVRVMELG